MNTAKKSKLQGGLRLSKVLALSLEERERSFRKAFRRCRRDGSEHTVHELRVSLRRLIATLNVLESILSAVDIREARRLLKKLLRSLWPVARRPRSTALFRRIAAGIPGLGETIQGFRKTRTKADARCWPNFAQDKAPWSGTATGENSDCVAKKRMRCEGSSKATWNSIGGRWRGMEPRRAPARTGRCG